MYELAKFVALDSHPIVPNLIFSNSIPDDEEAYLIHYALIRCYAQYHRLGALRAVTLEQGFQQLNSLEMLRESTVYMRILILSCSGDLERRFLAKLLKKAIRIARKGLQEQGSVSSREHVHALAIDTALAFFQSLSKVTPSELPDSFFDVLQGMMIYRRVDSNVLLTVKRVVGSFFLLRFVTVALTDPFERGLLKRPPGIQLAKVLLEAGKSVMLVANGMQNSDPRLERCGNLFEQFTDRLETAFKESDKISLNSESSDSLTIPVNSVNTQEKDMDPKLEAGMRLLGQYLLAHEEAFAGLSVEVQERLESLCEMYQRMGPSEVVGMHVSSDFAQVWKRVQQRLMDQAAEAESAMSSQSSIGSLTPRNRPARAIFDEHPFLVCKVTFSERHWLVITEERDFDSREALLEKISARVTALQKKDPEEVVVSYFSWKEQKLLTIETGRNEIHLLLRDGFLKERNLIKIRILA